MKFTDSETKRKMGEMHENTTAKELCEMLGESPDTLRMRLNALRKSESPLFRGVRWALDLSLSPEQVLSLSSKKVKRINSGFEKSRPQTVEMSNAKARPKEVAPAQIEQANLPIRKAALWAAFAMTAGASIPNMYEVTTAIKGNHVTAYAITGAFTIVPFLLIYARVRGLFAWLVVLGVMGYTGFCNAASIFGGLTSMDIGFELKPTVFLEAVTNMLNTPYLHTARALSGIMALIIGLIEVVAFKNLSK